MRGVGLNVICVPISVPSQRVKEVYVASERTKIASYTL